MMETKTVTPTATSFAIDDEMKRKIKYYIGFAMLVGGIGLVSLVVYGVYFT